MRLFLVALALFVACSAQLLAEEPPQSVSLTPAEQELVALMTEYFEALEPYWRSLDEFKSNEEYQAALADGTLADPSAEYIPKLLALEARHRGEDVGLLALWHVFRRAAGGGSKDQPPAIGRREAAGRLSAYAQSNLLPTVGRAALLGNFEPVVYDALAALVESPSIPEESRDVLRYFLVAENLQLQRSHESTTKRIGELQGGAEPKWADELEQQLAWLKTIPTARALQARAEAGIATLEQLKEDKASPILPGLQGVDDKWYIVRLAPDADPWRLADRATALLFEERHLRIDGPAPDLEVVLLDGTPWRMADQRNKVVVVQFSFTGCGPCAAMYPDLADLTEEHGDRLEVLTLMRDETAEHAQESVDSGKMTWSVSLDGKPGRITRQWSVDGFPTVYLIDRNGNISARNLRGDDLRKEIAELLDADG